MGLHPKYSNVVESDSCLLALSATRPHSPLLHRETEERKKGLWRSAAEKNPGPVQKAISQRDRLRTRDCARALWSYSLRVTANAASSGLSRMVQIAE